MMWYVSKKNKNKFIRFFTKWKLLNYQGLLIQQENRPMHTANIWYISDKRQVIIIDIAAKASCPRN